ncbi:MAG: hypothetical protein ABSF36_03655 [Candidatus Methanomethylicaceae archaeon]|jgi:hypothetical protein
MMPAIITKSPRRELGPSLFQAKAPRSMAAEPNISGIIHKLIIALINPKLISILGLCFCSEYDGDSEDDGNSDNV